MTERQVDLSRTRPSTKRTHLRILRQILFILVFLASFAGVSFTPTRAQAARSTDPQSNRGEIHLPAGSNGVEVSSSETATIRARPQLEVTHTTELLNYLSDQPVLIRPADGGTVAGASATLEVQASDPDSDTLSVSFYGRIQEDTPAPGEDFTLVVLPDTQYYVNNPIYAPIFTQQTQWIVDNQAAKNIVFVTHVGDIVQQGYNPAEFELAAASMDVLDAAGVPYSVGPGNHDMLSPSKYEDYFGVSRFQGKPWYGGHFGSDNYNNYSLFSASGYDFILINLQFDPEPAHLDWADALLKAHPDRRGIVVSHQILNYNDNWRNQGIYLALKDNPNLFLMLCGHRYGPDDGAAYRAEPGDDGHTIHIMLANYQGFPNGGNGYMRLLRFSPAEDKIYATTYSPYLDPGPYAYRTTYPDQMEMAYDMDWESSVPFELLGRVENVASGASAAITWEGLTIGATYEWYVVVEDDEGEEQTPKWTFTTEPFVNQPPVLYSIGNKSVDEGSELAFTASATDPNLDPLTFSMEGAPEGAIFTEQGAFTWTPTEAQGPGEYTVTVKVCDNGGLCDEEEITLSVAEVNRAPVLSTVGIRSVYAGSTLAFTAAATDSDLPANTLTFSLVDAPEGAAIDPKTGAFTWTPTEAQGGKNFTFAVMVCDDGSPVLCDEEELTVTVNQQHVEGGTPPQNIFLPFITGNESSQN